MIRKDLDEIKVTDKFSKAGIEAERQLAFYLKRAFEDDPKVLRIKWATVRFSR